MIELVAVIVVLGILAATVLPRMFDATRSAHLRTLDSMAGALRSAANLVHAKARLQGLHAQPLGSVDLDGDGLDDVQTEYGYPSDSRSGGITSAMDASFVAEWAWSSRLSPQRVVLTSAALSTSGPGQKINNVPITTGQCYITYIAPSSAGAGPSIELTTTGC